MAELVGGALLSSFFQVAIENLASSQFKDYFRRHKLDDRLVKKLEITLNSINQVLDDAEKKQYQSTYVKKWLDDLKHAVYETDLLFDEIATHAHLKKSQTVTTKSGDAILPDKDEQQCATCSAANIRELVLDGCGNISLNEIPSNLKKASIYGTEIIESSLGQILCNSACLEELNVGDFSGPNLQYNLNLHSCNSLHTLSIKRMPSSSLPFTLDLFSNLHSLTLHDCPQLNSFPVNAAEEDLSRNLKDEACLRWCSLHTEILKMKGETLLVVTISWTKVSMNERECLQGTGSLACCWDLWRIGGCVTASRVKK
ncbi:hypothetical protein VNO77_26818 [Canavalia gladiata]|uniref:Disease resistance N-terminal domain-containing protein n=1 Tax=Canavalia gladiata TaxID=3824 RepID=A0AAN9KVS6_CANGL